jgi:hypothetical protein
MFILPIKSLTVLYLGVTVYKMRIGSEVLMRCADTDFVHLTPILNYSRSPCPVLSTISNAIILRSGPKCVQGVWVTLACAQTYVKHHPVPGPRHIVDGVSTFLCGSVVKHFPLSFQKQVQKLRNDKAQESFSFGVFFGGDASSRGPDSSNDIRARPQFTPITVSIPEKETKETPLSATEREIFQALCVNHVWEKSDGSKTSCPSSPIADNFTISVPQTPKILNIDSGHSEMPTPQRLNKGSVEKPLRRSKRVAAAVAAEARVTRSKKRATRKRL